MTTLHDLVTISELFSGFNLINTGVVNCLIVCQNAFKMHHSEAKKSQIFLGRGIALFQTPPHWGVTIPSIYSNTPYTYNYVLEKSAIMRYISLTFTSHHIIRTTIRPSWWHCSLSSDAIYRCSSQLREECISPVASILDNISTFLRVFASCVLVPSSEYFLNHHLSPSTQHCSYYSAIHLPHLTYSL